MECAATLVPQARRGMSWEEGKREDYRRNPSGAAPVCGAPFQGGTPAGWRRPGLGRLAVAAVAASLVRSDPSL